jgi:hypothetical protein
MAITRGSLSKMLVQGLNAIYEQSYNEYAPIYPKVFMYNKSSKAYEEDAGIVGTGLAPIITEGAPVSMDTITQGFIQRYTHTKYGLGFTVTMEAYEDNQYRLTQQMLRSPRALGRSIRVTQETIAHNVFNRAFNSSYKGADGKEMCATDHPNAGGAGGTYQNEPTTPADLSEAALEQAKITISRWTDSRGLPVNARIKTLFVPSDLSFEAYRITKSVLRTGSAENDPNALRAMGIIPEVIESPYLTDTDAWFLITDVPDGLKYFERLAPKFDEDNDFLTDNAMYKAVFRACWGWTDPKGIWGSPGK